MAKDGHRRTVADVEVVADTGVVDFNSDVLGPIQTF